MNPLKPTQKGRFIAIASFISLLFSLYSSVMLIREVAAQTTHEVRMTNFAFVPQTLTIGLGDTVIWNNTDPVIHTLWFVFVTNESTYLLSDPILPDTTWSYTFDDAVELQYYSFDMLWITGFINVTAEVHDVAVADVVPSKTIVGQGYFMNISILVANQGEYTETFNLTVYCNNTAIILLDGKNYTTITLTSGNTKTVTVTWNTTELAKGNYTMKAVADRVPGETGIGDNVLIDGIVLVGVPCDVTGPTQGVPDYVCNMRDIGYFCSKFGTTPSSPNWDPNCDVTGPTPRVPDGIVNMRDIGEACSNFGQNDP